ncbi:MAG: signal peptidase II [Firmicutes bacterium]|nr:signal peptidase II [Bacillota bacterium]
MIVFAMGFLVFCLDQLSKQLVQKNMIPGESISLIPGMFHLTYVQNTGAAFGILKEKTSFFVVITALVVLAIVFAIPHIQREHLFLRSALGLMLGGALGNFVDRARFGHVIDFIDFRIWPVFNVADMAIVMAVGFLFWKLLVHNPEGL